MDSNSCFNSCFTKRLFLIPSIEFDLLPACIVTIPPNSSVIRLHVSLKGHEIRSCPFLSTSAGVSLHCPWIFVQIVVKSAVSGKIPIKCIASHSYLYSHKTTEYENASPKFAILIPCSYFMILNLATKLNIYNRIDE